MMFRDLAVAGDGGDRHARGDVGAGVRDEHLRAVDDPLAAFEARGRLCGAGIRAGAGLGQSERGELAPRCEVGQPPALLLLATK